jgi:exopolyphosphatase/guanosine-5'-triphosphate,3'-diphosphate pyrophosphatase
VVRIAAVDLGSNSFHLVIVDVSGSGAFQVVDREKEMIRLGAGTLSRGRLPAEAMRRGLDTLRRYRRLAQTHRVDKMLAVATSAIREASNGEDFLEQVGRAIDVWPKAISGEEEARLIYLAALHSIHLEGRRALVIDIGGGSLELAVGVGSRLEHAVSEKLGVLRLSERFVHSDPLSARDEARLQAHVEDMLGERAHGVLGAGFEAAIGTSGTILALGALAHEMETGRRAESCTTSPCRPPPCARCASGCWPPPGAIACACPGWTRSAPTSSSRARCCWTRCWTGWACAS